MTGIIINNLTFGYSTQIFNNLNIQFSEGWTAIVGNNGCGKTTLLRLIKGELKPWSGGISTHGLVSYCSQHSENPPENSQDFLYDFTGVSMRLRGILNIEYDWPDRWPTLSYGERIRFQIACALFQEPDILLTDEPTNHLDKNSREMIINSLKLFKGTGLLVSHDRALLEQLPFQCLFINPPNVTLRKGTYSSGKIEEEREYKEAVRLKNKLGRTIKKLETAADNKKRLTAKAESDSSKRRLDNKDHDAKAKIDLGRLTGKDAVQAKMYSIMQNRIAHEKKKLSEADVKIKRELKLYNTSEEARSDYIIRLNSGILNIGKRKLVFPEIEISPGTNIGIKGANGTGKSSFIKYLIKMNTNSRTLYIPQEISMGEADIITKRIDHLNRTDKGKVFASLDRLGSDPHRILNTNTPSPGELRKLLLSEGFLYSPKLLIMDEPTNHMDLGTIEKLESTLSEIDCAIILVSHDDTFLNNTTNEIWEIVNTDDKNILMLAKP